MINEYRLIPIQDKDNKGLDKQVTLQEIFTTIWNGRKIIFKTVFISLLVGIFIVLISPVEYESSSSLLLEDRNSESAGSNLVNRYGGILGIGNNDSRSTTLSPSLFPQIIQGLPFQISLMKENLRFSSQDTTVTAFGFFDGIYERPITEIIARYTIGLPSRIESMFSSSSSKTEQATSGQKRTAESIFTVTSDTMYVSNHLKDRISISVENNGNIINVTTMMPDPYAAANLGSNTVSLLKEHIKNYRTKKASENLEYAQKQLESAEKNWEEAQTRLAEFNDSNVNLATARAKTRLQKLESEYDLTFNVYSSLAERVEELKLKLQEETPGFTTIEPFQVPRNNSKPNAKLILFASIFLGFAGSIAYILIKGQWQIYISTQEN